MFIIDIPNIINFHMQHSFQLGAILKHHVVHFKFRQFLLVNYISIKLGGRKQWYFHDNSEYLYSKEWHSKYLTDLIT